MGHANQTWRQLGFVYEQPELKNSATEDKYENLEAMTRAAEAEGDLVNRPEKPVAHGQTPQPIDIPAYLTGVMIRETEKV